MALKKRIFGRLLGLIAAASFIVPTAPAFAQSQSDMAHIIQTKVVRIGAIEAYPYYRHDLRTGKWVGIIPELAELMFGSIGVKVEYVPTDWGTAAAGLQSNRFDLVGALNATPQRALAVDFSRPISQGRLAVLTLKRPDASYEHWSSLNQPTLRVAAVEGASTTLMAQKLLPQVKWTLVKAHDAMVMELESGRVDAIVSNEPTLDLYAQSKGKGASFVSVPQSVVSSPVNIAMRKGNPDLREWLNIAIQYYQADGSFKQIYDKYLPESN
jgi:polar amino acid transport system substrate-binding protein